MLLMLHYTKFGVSNFFSSKVIEEKPLGGGSTLGKGRVKKLISQIACEHALVHISRVFHLFLISSIFINTETRVCRHALENTYISYFGISFFYW